MRWEELEQSAPGLADLGRAKLGEPGVVLVGTIRTDGSPRVSPVEPLFWNRTSATSLSDPEPFHGLLG